MDVASVLEAVRHKASEDPSFLRELLASRGSGRPVATFCAVVRRAGFDLSEMDLISAGEEMYAAMLRSTNGGGENSPALAGEDDLYEDFMTELSHL